MAALLTLVLIAVFLVSVVAMETRMAPRTLRSLAEIFACLPVIVALEATDTNLMFRQRGGTYALIWMFGALYAAFNSGTNFCIYLGATILWFIILIAIGIAIILRSKE